MLRPLSPGCREALLPVLLVAAACTTATTAMRPTDTSSPGDVALIPLPASVVEAGAEHVAVVEPRGGGPLVTVSDPADPELRRLGQVAELPVGARLRLSLRRDGAMRRGMESGGHAFPHRDESYRLAVSGSTVEVESATHAGLFYGLQTLRQLADGPGRLVDMTIEDSPRFGYRGLHLDVSRHMFPPEFIKRLIDEMSRFKLNAFHWHLTDDQGWRIEIDAYPLLTEVGAWRHETMVERNFDPYVGDGQRYGGYYTKREIRDIVAYAAERYVTIIPEIEMPGHATAALAAYPELSCTGGRIDVETTWGVHPDIFCPSEATFEFLEAVLDEVIELFPGPYVHVGGDEAPKIRWEESPEAQEVIAHEGLADEAELQSWFIRRIEAFLSSRDRRLIGWDEILEGGLAPGATVMSWRGTSGGVEAALSGHDVIISPNADLYLDHYQGTPEHEPLAIGGLTTLEEVYAFEPIPAELAGDESLARRVLGPQANVWTEYMPDSKHVEYMIFPRLLALAEVAWSPAHLRDEASFLGRLPERLRALGARGVAYRVPPATGLDEDLPTLGEAMTIHLGESALGDVRYTLDGSDPGAADAGAQGPLRVPATANGTVVSARRFSPDGRASPLRRAEVRRVRPLPALPGPASPASGLRATAVEGAFESVAQLEAAVDLASGHAGVARGVHLPDAGGAPPEPAAPFGLVLEGWLRVPETGIYRFALTSDDGSDLRVSGVVVVDHDGLHGSTTRAGSIALAAGLHPIRVRYFDAGGARTLSLEVRLPDGSDVPVPPSWFLHDASGSRP